MDDIKGKLKSDDLTGTWKTVSEEIGIDNLLYLFDLFGGRKIYIPKIECTEMYVIKRLAFEEHKRGCSMAEIGRRYKIDQRTVKKYITEMQERGY